MFWIRVITSFTYIGFIVNVIPLFTYIGFIVKKRIQVDIQRTWCENSSTKLIN